MELTENQINFLLDIFFANPKYPGWKSIATSLITKGKCTVAGDRCIWIGGVGNFITTNTAPDLFSCLEYTFNLSYFLSSEYYKSVKESYMENLKEDMDNIIAKHNEIEALI